VGYDPVPFESDRLAAFFQRVATLTMPIGPDLSGYGGCDGTMYQLAAFGDLFSACRFQWWSSWPPHWQPLVDIASEMIEAFTDAEAPDAEPLSWPTDLRENEKPGAG
ncbi:MAG TPA: hypothetical protein VM938_05970, partial [Acidimicrobiales bacterium]|nr:hypothetical protein [Acidimicrobiales bacterium]